jgi:hypothetical protein
MEKSGNSTIQSKPSSSNDQQAQMGNPFTITPHNLLQQPPFFHPAPPPTFAFGVSSTPLTNAPQQHNGFPTHTHQGQWNTSIQQPLNPFNINPFHSLANQPQNPTSSSKDRQSFQMKNHYKNNRKQKLRNQDA